ncbi:MAG: hypothetical protein ACE5IZ_01900 [Dehalococcoidia bacterium]
MRFWRTEREELVDSLLTLALTHICAPTGYLGDRLKLTKLIFAATLETFRTRCKGFNFSFYRYSWGPFTKELYHTWGDLYWAGLLEVQPGSTGLLGLTDEGHELAERFIREVMQRDENQPFLEVMDKVADSYAPCSTGELLRRVYAMEVVPIGWSNPTTLGATPMEAYFTAPIEERDAVLAVQIPEPWLKTFDLRRQRSQSEVAEARKFYDPRIIEQLDEAIAADLREEGERLTVDDVNRIKQEYGLS